MKLSFVDRNGKSARPLALPRFPGAGRLQELEPVVVEVPVEVILYLADQEVEYQGMAMIEEGGEAIVTIPIQEPPPDGTPIQIVIPGQDGEDTVIEGVTEGGESEDVIDVVVDIPDSLWE